MSAFGMFPLNYENKYVSPQFSGYPLRPEFFNLRPKDWSVPQWIAYWAAGWYKDNIRYREKIKSRISTLESLLDKATSSGFKDGRSSLKGFLEVIKDSSERITSSIYSNSLEHFEDDDGETTFKMNNLRDKYTEIVTKEVEAQLARLDYVLDDQQKLQLVVGPRLESRLLCLMNCLLKRHLKQFESERASNPLSAASIVDMLEPWMMVFEAFPKRMYTLVESWRQQRMDVDNQVKHYANGLFESWWGLAPKASNTSDDWGEESDDEEEDTPASGDDYYNNYEADHVGNEHEDLSWRQSQAEETGGGYYPDSPDLFWYSQAQSAHGQEGNYPENPVVASAVLARIDVLEANISTIEEKIDTLNNMMMRLLKEQSMNDNSNHNDRQVNPSGYQSYRNQGVNSRGNRYDNNSDDEECCGLWACFKCS